MADNSSDTPNVQSAPAQAEVKLSRRQRKKQEIAEGKRSVTKVPQQTRPNIFRRGYTFFQEAKVELGRVVWPSRQDTIKSTGVLLVLVAIAAVYLGVVDRILSLLLQLLARA